MIKILWIVGVCCLIQTLVCTPAVAKEEIARTNSSSNFPYFEPKSSDGSPIRRPAGCGNDGTRIDSFSRDLGEGVSFTVIPTYDDAKLLSVNLIFEYTEKGGLTISPEKFELHALPDEQIFTPKSLHRGAPSTNAYGRFREEVYLEFSIQPENAKQIAVVLPEGTVRGEYSALKIAPVRFDRTGQFSGGPKPKLMPCLYSTEPPSRLDAARLQALPPIAPLKPLKLEQLKGTWIADAKASAEIIKSSPPPSMDEFLSVAGWMFLFVYEFADGVVTLGTYTGDKKTTYRLLPQQSNKTKFVYRSENPQGTGDDLLTVSAMSGNNIKISSSPYSLTGQFAFKHVKLNPKTRAQDAELALKAVQEFMKILSDPSSSSIKPDATR